LTICAFCLKALAGEVGMSSELDEVARALFNGHIPVIWRKLAPDTLKSLGNWMIHFKRRHEQYSSWVRIKYHTTEKHQSHAHQGYLYLIKNTI